MNWDYIAGFFDGEGCITYGRSKRYRIMISQTHKEVLESIRDFVGVGYVVEVAKRKSHWKDSWVFYIAKQEDSLKFTLLHPLLKSKNSLLCILFLYYQSWYNFFQKFQ